MATVKTWGERLFYEEHLHGRKGLQPKDQKLNFRKPKGGSSGGGKTANYYRERLHALAEGHPQVNVKITGVNKSLGGFAAHVSYISHNGEEELENENGEVFGKLSAEELQELWGGDLSTNETGENKHRENYHIVFSMPPDTDREKFSKAARETVHELFAENHRFLMAEHHNTSHPHLHVVVKAVGENGRRLNPKKADLHRWRETFAENLRAHGIKAEATSRQVRGNFKKSLNRSIAQIHKKNKNLPEHERVKPTSESQFENDVRQRATSGKPYEHSKALQKAKNTRAVVRGMYNAMIKDLERSEYEEDRILANKLRVFLNDMPRINPREKVIYEEHREQLEKAKAMQSQLAERKENRAEQQVNTQPSTDQQQGEQQKQKSGHKPRL